MSVVRDRWVAANLSWSFAGLGQLYAGRRVTGTLLLALDLLCWSGYVAWALSPDLPLSFLEGVSAGQFLLWIVASWAAHRTVARQESAPDVQGNPWKAVFFSRILPGWGQVMAGRWARGIVGCLVSFALFLSLGAYHRFLWVVLLYGLVRGLVSLDAYYVLRRGNRLPSRAVGVLLGLIFALAQGVLLVKLVHLTLAEVYKIPSSAMEPTLMGDASAVHDATLCPFSASHKPPQGDRVLVSRVAYTFGPIRRFDVAVFTFPLNRSKVFVKRVVGLPNEELLIHGGDLYTRSAGEAKFRIVRKPLDVQDHLWIEPGSSPGAPPLTKPPGGPSTMTGSPFRLKSDLDWPPGEEMGYISGPIPFTDFRGRRAEDIRQVLKFRTGKSRSEAAFRLINSRVDVEVLLSTAPRSQVVLRKAGGGETMIALEGLRTDRDYAFEFMVFDGQLVIRRDGVVVVEHPYATHPEETPDTDESRNLLAVGARGGETVLGNMTRGCDLHYSGRMGRELAMSDDEPVKIPEGCYLVFGDHVANSHDSRAWIRRSFKLKDGRTIVCEDQVLIRGYSSDFLGNLQKKNGLARIPDLGIEGDQDGNEVAIFQDQIVDQTREAFRFVERQDFLGRVLKVWWPPERARAIR